MLKVGILGIVFALAAALAYAFSARLSGPLPRLSGPYAVMSAQVDVPGPSAAIPVYLWYPEIMPDKTPGIQGTVFPLVLFASGWGGVASESSFLLAELASHGYVVAAINDLGQDPPGADGDDQPATRAVISAAFDLSSDAAAQKAVATGALRVQLLATKAKHVLDGMTRLDRTVPGFADRIDAGHVGMLGYSLGGAVAAEVSRSDSRIKAVANLDGWLFADAAEKGVDVPYLAIASAEAFPPPSDLTSPDPRKRLSAQWCERDFALHRRFLQNEDFHWFLAEDMSHHDLTDGLFKPSWRDAIARSWAVRLDRHRRLNTAVVSFFDQYLKHGVALTIPMEPLAPTLRPLSAMSRP